ncbi:uncharacterized protein [Pyxicephalus adspersus]|uniref:uncharacterized protein isoform X2 n=1 Tax=Pyxicephalus adspersus TaxID=30357 RepID=UPI003B5985D5
MRKVEISLHLLLIKLNPKFLHTNSTSHTWPFGAIAEIIDNGKGMTADKLHKMLRQKRSGAPECTLGPAKKPYVAISETNELLNGDGNAAADVIIIEDSTPKLNDNSKTPNSITPGLNTGVGASATVTNRGVMNVKHECSNGYANNSHQVLNNNNYSLSNGTTTQDANDYHECCEELSVKVKHPEDQLVEALGQQVKKETSQAYIQTDPVPTQDKSRELLLSQYSGNAMSHAHKALDTQN